MNDALRRLAAAAGIADGYWDGLSAWRGLSDTTARALLRAQGLDPDGDLAAQAERLEAGDFDGLDHAGAGGAAGAAGATGATGGQAVGNDDADAGCEGVDHSDRGGRTQAANGRGAALPPVIVLVANDGTTAALQVALTFAAADLDRMRDQSVSGIVTLGSGERLPCTFALASAGQARSFSAGGTAWVTVDVTGGLDLPFGYHRLELPVLAAASALIVAPRRCYVPPDLDGGRRVWGIAVHLYALRSTRNWGIGDFTDLAAFALLAGRSGAALVGLNPLHARHLARPDEASPYSPSSRLFLDPMYLDVTAIEDFTVSAAAQAAVADAGFQAQLVAARAASMVDHGAVFRLKLPVLEMLFHAFRDICAVHGESAARVRDFAAFRLLHGAALERFAEFEALRLDWVELTGALPQWREWPPEWRDPQSAALAGFRVDAALQIEFQMYLQWQAARQLEAASAAARAAGLSLGLYCDLAVGAAADSAESWGAQELMATGVNIGAPPDLLSRNGQNWGLPPWNPRALARHAYQPFAALIADNMRHAAALRIDHVMALTRLFWIPEGMSGGDGGYVRFPFAALTAIIALESWRNRCLVIGEDLGAVPDGLREQLHERGFLSYRVLVFERHWNGDGNFKRPHEYPAQALATVATHDMPTIADWWAGTDIGRRAELGFFPEPHLQDEERQRRVLERQRMLELLGELGLAPADTADPGQVIAALHAAVARTPAMLAVVQLDDLLGEILPANIPGTYREYPNWLRKVSRTLDEIGADAVLERLGTQMREAGRG